MSWIEDLTNHNEEYWVARTQAIILRNTVLRDDGHGETDYKWLHELVDEVIENLPPPDPPYDGNMGMAARLSIIFALWFSSVQLAKTFDSHRPTYVRQEAYDRLQNYKHQMFDIMTNMSKFSTYFPEQPWQFPFDPAAKGGDFL